MNIKKTKNWIIGGYFVILFLGFLFALYLLQFTEELGYKDVCFSWCKLNPFSDGYFAYCDPFTIRAIISLYINSAIFATITILFLLGILKIIENKNKG